MYERQASDRWTKAIEHSVNLKCDNKRIHSNVCKVLMRMEAARVSNNERHMLKFNLKISPAATIGPRLGQLSFNGGKVVDTPHHVAATSRGVVPHVAQNVMRKNTSIKSVYMGLEDFMEKSTSEKIPILRAPKDGNTSTLSSFTALPDQVISILGPRRIPPVHSPAHNTASAISVLTSVGFQPLDISDYVAAARTLNPDITIAMGDFVTHAEIGKKRIVKSIDRTHTWLQHTLTSHNAQQSDLRTLNLFAQILPFSKEAQALYLQDLGQEYRDVLAGLALPTIASTQCITDSISHLPRLLSQNIRSPHELLDAIMQGCDLITSPFANESSDAGLAFAFRLDPQAYDTTDKLLPLAHDLWSPTFAADLSPLTDGCQCYTCTRHHRAYLHHLLQVKEMLAWTLLQIHNHAVLDVFFESIRDSIASGMFENDVKGFKTRYVPEMPIKTGQGPRIRGYQMKSVGGGEPKKNAKVWGKLDDQIERLADAEESAVPSPSEDSQDLEQRGFARKAENLEDSTR